MRCWSNIMAFPLSWLFSHLRSRENSHTLGIFDEGQVNVPLLNFNVHCAYYYSTSGHLCDYPDCHWTLSWSGMSDLSVGDMEILWISVIGDISLILPIFWYTHLWVKSKIFLNQNQKIGDMKIRISLMGGFEEKTHQDYLRHLCQGRVWRWRWQTFLPPFFSNLMMVEVFLFTFHCCRLVKLQNNFSELQLCATCCFAGSGKRVNATGRDAGKKCLLRHLCGLLQVKIASIKWVVAQIWRTQFPRRLNYNCVE